MTEANEKENTETGGSGGGKLTLGGKKSLSVARAASPSKLELKKTVDAGQVRQSFSHGRSKAVSVEVRRKRTFQQGEGGVMTEVKDMPVLEAPEEAPTVVEEAPPAVEPAAPAGPPRTLTEAERASRARALKGAKRSDEFERQVAEEMRRVAAHEAEENARLAKDDEARLKAEEEAKQIAAEAQRMADEEKAKLTGGGEAPGRLEAKKPEAVEAPAAVPAAAEEEDEEVARRRPGRPGVTPRRPTPTRRTDPRRRTGKLTITQAMEGDEVERVRSLASVRRAREREKRANQQRLQEQTKIVREVVIPDTITVQELSNRMAERGAEVVKALMKLGVMATITQTIDADTAELVIAEFGHKARRVSEADVEVGLTGGTDEEGALQPRPPVVTVMGHVDHGKTSLLDALRHTDVAAGEAGGITQHIGAYQVTLENGAKITFIDTPGHEAFTAMRARGAKATDIVVLVVAADDSVMPQTVEAIAHAKAAEVPIIVAINKIDRPNADPEKVKRDLLSHELVAESMGGDVQTVEVSATQKIGLDKLVEAIQLQAEILELAANPDRPAEGVVIESKLEQGRGPVATLLVQRGTLRQGDILVAGSEWGRVRALLGYDGKPVAQATPSMPVELLGLNAVPLAGDEFTVVESESRAREVTEFRQHRDRRATQTANQRGTLDQMFARIAAGEAKELPVLIKTDVQGSAEALQANLESMSTDEVKMRVLQASVGGINESDIALAKTAGAIVIGFNVRANPQARERARRDGVDIRYYSIIYEVADDMKLLLGGLLAPVARENMLGNARILQVFRISKTGNVAGCRVTDGVVRRGAKVRLLRDNVVIHTGTLSTLKRFKDEVREVREGFECGMAFENYNDIRVDDVIECYEVEQVARTL
jgi:translation initiation factor IF-2